MNPPLPRPGGELCFKESMSVPLLGGAGVGSESPCACEVRGVCSSVTAPRAARGSKSSFRSNS